MKKEEVTEEVTEVIEIGAVVTEVVEIGTVVAVFIGAIFLALLLIPWVAVFFDNYFHWVMGFDHHNLK